MNSCVPIGYNAYKPYTLKIILKIHGYTMYTLKSQALRGEVLNVIGFINFNFVINLYSILYFPSNDL